MIKMKNEQKVTVVPSHVKCFDRTPSCWQPDSDSERIKTNTLLSFVWKPNAKSLYEVVASW
jgi:hypothetical protein